MLGTPENDARQVIGAWRESSHRSSFAVLPFVVHSVRNLPTDLINWAETHLASEREGGKTQLRVRLAAVILRDEVDDKRDAEDAGDVLPCERTTREKVSRRLRVSTALSYGALLEITRMTLKRIELNGRRYSKLANTRSTLVE